MERLYTSRKIWGALLGSISIIVVVRLAAPEVSAIAVNVLGILWGAAIGGQAVADAIKTNKNNGGQ